MNKLIPLAIAVALVGSGCAVRMTRGEHRRLPPPPPGTSYPAPAPAPAPPPPVVYRMSYDEAVHMATQYAAARGYSSYVKKAHLTGNDVWKVKLQVRRADARGKLHVDFDAFSREVIRAQENVKYRKHARDDDHDDDDDDDRRGKGRVHGAGAVVRR